MDGMIKNKYTILLNIVIVLAILMASVLQSQAHDTSIVSKTSTVISGYFQRPESPAWVDNAVFYLSLIHI